jgi:hypothetical protein
MVREDALGNTMSNAYETPLSVDLSHEERAKVFKHEWVEDAVKNAKRAARQYSNIVLNRLEANFGTTFEKSDMELMQVMAQYGVHKELREYASKVCRRLINEKLVR